MKAIICRKRAPTILTKKYSLSGLSIERLNLAIIVKLLIPIYSKKDNVPKRYLNLRKAVYATTFKHLYPNIPDILVKKYSLKPDEKIVVVLDEGSQPAALQQVSVAVQESVLGIGQ